MSTLDPPLCKRCRMVIPAEGSLPADPGLIVDRSTWFVAWLAEYCSPVCQANDALTKVALSQAWWQK